MIRGLLVLTLIIFVINLGYLFSAPVIKNRMLEAKMAEIATNRGNKSDQALRADLMSFIREKSIDLGPQDIMLERRGEKIFIAARYSTDVHFISYSRHYEFFPVSDDKSVLYWKQAKGRTYKTGA